MAKLFQYDGVPAVQTKAGKLQGYSYNGAYIFKGIPYAKADRFQMPAEVDPWEGVKDVTSYGFVCPLLNQERPTGELLVPHRYWPQDEHCQNLNIWTNTLDPAAKKPVMVWLHGGGYSAGSSIEQEAYDGFEMCTHGDLVVVSVNHRLNILGYLDLSPFGEKYTNSANAGHADLVASLKWIRDNIASFGGDPDNVTLFGQSGGGMKATGLMQIPEADGLFHKAIIMSGVSDGKLLPEIPGDGRQIVLALLAELGIPEAEVEKLETVPYHDLAMAYNKVSPAMMMQGIYTGNAPMKNEFYRGEPLLTGFTEHAKTIPFIVGSVFGEFSFMPSPYNKYELSEGQIKDILTEKYGEHAQKLIDLFAAAYPDKNAVDILSLDRIFRIPSIELAKLQAKEGKAPSYLYEFVLEFPYQNGKPSWHCSDIPFIFHNTGRVEISNIPGVSDELEEKIFGAAAAFAHTGDPNHSGLPHWPAVSTDNVPTMIYDRECRVGIDYDEALLNLLEEISPPFSLAALFAQDIQH